MMACAVRRVRQNAVWAYRVSNTVDRPACLGLHLDTDSPRLIPWSSQYPAQIRQKRNGPEAVMFCAVVHNLTV